jgi:hypothetical protein
MVTVAGLPISCSGFNPWFLDRTVISNSKISEIDSIPSIEVNSNSSFGSEDAIDNSLFS